MPNRAYAAAAVRALAAMRDGREVDTRDLLELLDGQVTDDKRAAMYAVLHRGGVLPTGAGRAVPARTGGEARALGAAASEGAPL